MGKLFAFVLGLCLVGCGGVEPLGSAEEGLALAPACDRGTRLISIRTKGRGLTCDDALGDAARNAVRSVSRYATVISINEGGEPSLFHEIPGDECLVGAQFIVRVDACSIDYEFAEGIALFID